MNRDEKNKDGEDIRKDVKDYMIEETLRRDRKIEDAKINAEYVKNH
jgi:hypothetical protein